MIRSFLFICVFALSLSGVFVNDARAEDPKQVSVHGHWAVYAYKENGKKVCYMVSQPIKSEGNYTRRDEVFAFITHRPSENTMNVFSYITGYTYNKKNADAKISVAGETYPLFTQGDMAWTRDGATDKKLISAIKKGSKMVVKGHSGRGTLTTDTFSLKGSSAAHAAMSKSCGVK